MDLRFDEQVVLVTGASSGIGSALARGFAQAGANVAIHYATGATRATSLRDEIEATGGRGFCVQADLSTAGGAAQLMTKVADHSGRLDVLVNNAGIQRERASLDITSDQSYQDLIDVNLSSVFRLCRAAIPLLERSAPSAIINVTSLAARTGGGGGNVVYAATKAAVATLTRGLAVELAPRGIRVNSMSPGLVETPIHGESPPEVIARLIAATPLKRVAQPEECVGPVLFLASETSSSYVTGHALEVNGGRSMP